MHGPATELIHARRNRPSAIAVPLTTPIYETTTFVFENAQEVRRLQRRAIVEVSLLALQQPDGRRGRAEAGGARPRRAALLFSSGMARDDDDR